MIEDSTKAMIESSIANSFPDLEKRERKDLTTKFTKATKDTKKCFKKPFVYFVFLVERFFYGT